MRKTPQRNPFHEKLKKPDARNALFEATELRKGRFLAAVKSAWTGAKLFGIVGAWNEYKANPSFHDALKKIAATAAVGSVLGAIVGVMKHSGRLKEAGLKLKEQLVSEAVYNEQLRYFLLRNKFVFVDPEGAIIGAAEKPRRPGPFLFETIELNASVASMMALINGLRGPDSE